MEAPYLLVASPTMLDSSFARTVVLVLSHDEDGAHGLVINRPLDLTVSDITEDLEMETGLHGDLTVMWGGPVEAQTGFVLVRNPEPDNEELRVLGGGLGVGLSKKALEQALVRTHGDFLLCLGYAGWAAEQLEGEMKIGSWVEVDVDQNLLFEEPLEDRWERAILLLGIENPAYLSTVPVDE